MRRLYALILILGTRRAEKRVEVGKEIRRGMILGVITIIEDMMIMEEIIIEIEDITIITIITGVMMVIIIIDIRGIMIEIMREEVIVALGIKEETMMITIDSKIIIKNKFRKEHQDAWIESRCKTNKNKIIDIQTNIIISLLL